MKAALYVDYANAEDEALPPSDLVRIVQTTVRKYAHICFTLVYVPAGYSGCDKPMKQDENYKLWLLNAKMGACTIF